MRKPSSSAVTPRRTAQVSVVPGSSAASSAKVMMAVSAEWPLPEMTVYLPANWDRTAGSVRSGAPVADPVSGGLLADDYGAFVHDGLPFLVLGQDSGKFFHGGARGAPDADQGRRRKAGPVAVAEEHHSGLVPNMPAIQSDSITAQVQRPKMSERGPKTGAPHDCSQRFGRMPVGDAVGSERGEHRPSAQNSTIACLFHRRDHHDVSQAGNPTGIRVARREGARPIAGDIEQHSAVDIVG